MTDDRPTVDLEKRDDAMPPDEYIELVEAYGVPIGNCPDCGRPIFDDDVRERRTNE